MTEMTKRRPGTRLMQVGGVIAVVFFVLAIAAPKFGASPFVITLIIAGVITVIVGFARRLLAAVERR